MAGRGFMALVEMAVAMAFGASVQPFTRTTARVRITVISRAGFSMSWDIKLVKSIIHRSPLYFIEFDK